ncbi:MAG: proteasome-activating nucleotidase [Candidatus Methanoperedens sp.]|nr:proteasome-activating nucleotidase [Candidatus Methanoperedens sp.]MCZ7360923.1 proteasome-activating nucleotidase [Candidatus Methanoperedens sp.]HLB70633.1 proteasome-activating nucleotidase [Candidatus Methanoperedens sp.]
MQEILVRSGTESLVFEESPRDVKEKELKERLLEALVANKYHSSKLQDLQIENARLKSMPLFIASVVEKQNENIVMLRMHGSEREFLTRVGDKVYEALDLNTRVAVNNAFNIVKVLSRSADPRAVAMQLIEAPETDYDMIGGLDPQIQEIKEAMELPFTEPELFRRIGIKPQRGILLYGPPGTGKTMIARAVAHRTNATFIKLSGPELVHKYLGEGARLVREIFQIAQEKAPAIVFIDEIDAVGSTRMQGNDGSEEVNRTMMQLLAELDGFKDRGEVRVIAATNRIDMLDPALLRPGRFDRKIEIPLPEKEGRRAIFVVHTQHMPLEDVDLEMLASITEGASGADINAIATEAGMFAIRRKGEKVTMSDFQKALEKFVQKKSGMEFCMFA